MKHMKRGFAYLLGGFWALVTLYPLFFVLISSFKNNNEIFSSANSAMQLPTVLRFENYHDALVVGGMARALLNSLQLAGMSTVITVLLASMVSFTLSRFRYKLRDVVYMFFLLGIMIPVHATLVPLSKIVAVTLKANNNLFVLALVYTAFHLPLAVMIITAAMRGISASMDEAALMDGCGPFRLYARIILPLAVPALSTVSILTFLYVYNDLLFGVLFISKQELYTIPRAMQTFVGSKITTYGPIFASIILAIGPMIVIYLLFQSKVEQGLTAGAIKE